MSDARALLFGAADIIPICDHYLGINGGVINVESAKAVIKVQNDEIPSITLSEEVALEYFN